VGKDKAAQGEKAANDELKTAQVEGKIIVKDAIAISRYSRF